MGIIGRFRKSLDEFVSYTDTCKISEWVVLSRYFRVHNGIGGGEVTVHLVVVRDDHFHSEFFRESDRIQRGYSAVNRYKTGDVVFFKGRDVFWLDTVSLFDTVGNININTPAVLLEEFLQHNG